MEFSNQLIELGGFVVQLLDATGEAPQIREAIRVLLQDVANSIEGMPGRGVELGGFDQVGGNFERYRRRSHNGTYIKFRPELAPLSGRNST
ncbi:hypothetical protein PSMEN_11620 [Ectopseudomonas mendocina]|nr:hypothetical protein PSMEN_11620 [Pseudomonas mendocina]